MHAYFGFANAPLLLFDACPHAWWCTLWARPLTARLVGLQLAKKMLDELEKSHIQGGLLVFKGACELFWWRSCDISWWFGFSTDKVAKYSLLWRKGEGRSFLSQLASLFLLLVARNLNRMSCSRWRRQRLTLMSLMQMTSQKHPLKVAPPTPQQQTLTQTKRSCPRMEVSLGKPRASGQTSHTEPLSNGFITL